MKILHFSPFVRRKTITSVLVAGLCFFKGIKERQSVGDDNKHNSCPDQLIKTVFLVTSTCFVPRDRNISVRVLLLGMIFLHDYTDSGYNFGMRCDTERSQWE